MYKDLQFGLDFVAMEELPHLVWAEGHFLIVVD